MENTLSTRLTIAHEYWRNEDFDEIVGLFKNDFLIEKTNVKRWSAEADPAILTLIFYLVGKNLIDSALSTLTSKMWETAIHKIR